DRRLSEEPARREAPGPRSFRPQPAADNLRHEDRSARGTGGEQLMRGNCGLAEGTMLPQGRGHIVSIRTSAKHHPMRRMGSIGEVIGAVLYLETASFVTGEAPNVDGGQHVGHW